MTRDLAPQQMTLARWIEAGTVRITETSLVIADPDFPFEDYTQLGILLAAWHRSSCWWIGDWILHGEGTYGEKCAQATEATKLSPGTLMNYASVCRRVPRSRRRIGLPFSVHAEVASLEPVEQKEWLAIAERDDLRQAELRVALRPLKSGDLTSEQAEQQHNANGAATIEDVRSLLRSIVKQAVGNGAGHYLVPGELILRAAAAVGEA
jgi:hypothetical protein